MPTVPRILPGVLAAVLLLGGCTVPTISVTYPTPSGTPTDKAVAAACSALGDAVTKAGATLRTALQQMGTDPQQALATVQPVVDDLQAAVAKVDNPAVRAQGDKTVAALRALMTALGEAVNDASKIPSLAAPFGTVQAELAAFASLCGG